MSIFLPNFSANFYRRNNRNNTGNTYRQTLTVTNNGTTKTNKLFSFRFKPAEDSCRILATRSPDASWFKSTSLTCNDVRIYNASGALIPFWIEGAGTWCVVIFIRDTITASASKNYTIEWGNPLLPLLNNQNYLGHRFQYLAYNSNLSYTPYYNGATAGSIPAQVTDSDYRVNANATTGRRQLITSTRYDAVLRNTDVNTSPTADHTAGGKVGNSDYASLTFNTGDFIRQEKNNDDNYNSRLLSNTANIGFTLITVVKATSLANYNRIYTEQQNQNDYFVSSYNVAGTPKLATSWAGGTSTLNNGLVANQWNINVINQYGSAGSYLLRTRNNGADVDQKSTGNKPINNPSTVGAYRNHLNVVESGQFQLAEVVKIDRGAVDTATLQSIEDYFDAKYKIIDNYDFTFTFSAITDIDIDTAYEFDIFDKKTSKVNLSVKNEITNRVISEITIANVFKKPLLCNNELQLPNINNVISSVVTSDKLTESEKERKITIDSLTKTEKRYTSKIYNSYNYSNIEYYNIHDSNALVTDYEISLDDYLTFNLYLSDITKINTITVNSYALPVLKQGLNYIQIEISNLSNIANFFELVITSSATGHFVSYSKLSITKNNSSFLQKRDNVRVKNQLKQNANIISNLSDLLYVDSLAINEKSVQYTAISLLESVQDLQFGALQSFPVVDSHYFNEYKSFTTSLYEYIRFILSFIIPKKQLWTDDDQYQTNNNPFSSSKGGAYRNFTINKSSIIKSVLIELLQAVFCKIVYSGDNVLRLTSNQHLQYYLSENYPIKVIENKDIIELQESQFNQKDKYNYIEISQYIPVDELAGRFISYKISALLVPAGERKTLLIDEKDLYSEESDLIKISKIVIDGFDSSTDERNDNPDKTNISIARYIYRNQKIELSFINTGSTARYIQTISCIIYSSTYTNVSNYIATEPTIYRNNDSINKNGLKELSVNVDYQQLDASIYNSNFYDQVEKKGVIKIANTINNNKIFNYTDFIFSFVKNRQIVYAIIEEYTIDENVITVNYTEIT